MAILLLWSLLVMAIVYWSYGLVVLWIDSHYTAAIRIDVDVPAPAPLVSIIVPARNEELNLPRCLESLRGQDYPQLEIVVVDDRSEDATGAIARSWADCDPRIQVIDGDELPAGWLGKNWANHQGVQRAGGEWLLFTDADTDHHPAGLRGSMSLALQADLDTLTLSPYLVCLTFWEKVFQPAIYTWISIHLPAYLVNRPSFPICFANGQYLLMRRATYDEIGGHTGIRDRIVDDMALAEKVRRHGRRFLVANGGAVLRVRMYTSLHDLWEGWSKNLMAGLHNRFGIIAGLIFMLLVTSVLPVVTLVLSQGGTEPATITFWLSAAACALMLVARAWGLALIELSPLYALLHPLAACLFVAILGNSALRSRSGLGVVWKGRVYQHPH